MKRKVIVLLSLLLVSCSSTSKVECGEINYSFDEKNMTASVVSSPNYNLSNLIIESNVINNGKVYEVTGISINAFKDNKYIEKVQMPNTIKNIGYDAFRNCTSLMEVEFSEQVTTLADHLFAGCVSLKSVKNVSNVENILKGTFENTGLEFISFSNLKSIGIDAFFNNSYLKEISLMGTYTSLSGSCFERCKVLETVNVSSTLASIGSYAFKDSYLSNFDFSNISSIGKYAFENTNVTSLEMNDVVLEEGSFNNCDELREIKLSTDEIPYLCFDDCNKLSVIEISNCKRIGSKAFYNSNVSSFTVCHSLEEISSSAFENSSIKSLFFEDNSSLKIISRRAFANAKLSGELKLPSSLKSIYNQAFVNNKLDSVSIYNNTDYDSNSFDGNVRLEVY